jgi:hypothetical protein
VGKAWTDVHGTVPPCISGTKQIDANETVRLLQEEKDPVLKQRIKYHVPDAVLPEPAKKTAKPSMSAVFIINAKIIDHSVWSKIEADSAQKVPEQVEVKPKSGLASMLNLMGKPIFPPLPPDIDPD